MPDVGSVKYRIEFDQSGLDKDIKSTENAISSKLDGLAGKLNKQFGYQVLKDVGAAFVEAGKAAVGFASDAVQTGMTFDASMSQVAATMGTTVDQIQDLRAFAQEMGATTAFSATQAADALNYMALAGYDAETSMKMLPNVLNLAAAGGIDLAYASDMVTDASSALGLSLDETSELVDKMAKTSSKSNTSVAQLGEAILTVGGTAKMMAGGTTELSMALGVLADNGIKGSEGGTALRNMILSLTAPTDKASIAMAGLGLQVFDAEGKMRPLNDIFLELGAALDDLTEADRVGAMSAIFNKVDLKSVNAMIGTSAERFDELALAIDSAGGTAGMSREGLVGLANDLLHNFDRLGGAGEEFHEEMMEYLKFEYGLDTSAAEEVLARFEESMANGSVTAEELATAIEGIGGAAQAMADTQLDNLQGSITLFQSALEGVQIAISDALAPTLKEFVDMASAGLGEVATALQAGDWDGAVQAVADFASNALQKIMDMLPKMLDAGIRILGSLMTGILQSLPQLAQSAVNIMVTLVNFIADNMPMIIDTAVKVLGVLVEGLINATPQLVDAALKIITALSQYIMSHGPEIVAKGAELLGKLIAGLIQAIPKMLIAARQIIHDLREAFFRIDWGEVGLNIIKGVANGISGALGIIRDAALDAARSAFNAAKNFFGIASPSKLMRDQIGKQIPAGMAQGIDEGASEVEESMTALSDQAFGALSVGVDYDLPDLAGYAQSLGASISAASSTEITVPVMLDGREIARGSAWYMNEQLAWEAR